MIKIGKRIKELRLTKKISQEKFSEDLCVTSSAVSKWENDLSYPDILKLVDIANYFKVSVDYLLDFKIKNNNVEIMVDDLTNSYKEKTFTFTPEELENTLRIFNQNFLINYTVAKYLYFYGISFDKKALELSLKGFQNSLTLFSQNNNSEITEYSIKNSIIELFIHMDKPQDAIDYINVNGLHTEYAMTKVMAYQMLNNHKKVLEHFPKGFLTHVSQIINGVFYLIESFMDNKDYAEVLKKSVWLKHFLKSIIVKESEWGYKLLNITSTIILISKYGLKEMYEDELNKVISYSKVILDPNEFKSDGMIFNYNSNLSIFNSLLGKNLIEDTLELLDNAIEKDQLFINLKEEYKGGL